MIQLMCASLGLVSWTMCLVTEAQLINPNAISNAGNTVAQSPDTFSKAGNTFVQSNKETYLMSIAPPECRELIDNVKKEATAKYEWIVNKKCAECPDGLKAEPVMLFEKVVKKSINSYLNWLAERNFDVDKVCPGIVSRKEIWDVYEKFKQSCIVDTGEFQGHQNLCTATPDDFPKTGDCIKAEASKYIEAKGAPLEDCLTKIIKHCTHSDLGAWIKHIKTMRENKEKFKEMNIFGHHDDFFKRKCRHGPSSK